MGKVCERAVTSALSSNGKQQLAYPSAVALLLEPWLFLIYFLVIFQKITKEGELHGNRTHIFVMTRTTQLLT
jgi:hypothetical protein